MLIPPAEGVFIFVIGGMVALGQVHPDGIQLLLILRQAGGQLAQDVHVISVSTVVVGIHEISIRMAQPLAADIGHPAQVLRVRKAALVLRLVLLLVFCPFCDAADGVAEVFCSDGAGDGGAALVFAPVKRLARG